MARDGNKAEDSPDTVDTVIRNRADQVDREDPDLVAPVSVAQDLEGPGVQAVAAGDRRDDDVIAVMYAQQFCCCSTKNPVTDTKS